MEEKEIWLEILKQCKGRYICGIELHRLTKEVGEALSRDDKISAQIQLGMRQDEISKMIEYDSRIQLLLNAYPYLQERVTKLLKGDCNLDLCESMEESEIAKTCGDLRTIMGKTLVIDKGINLKISGKDSFYAINEI